MLSLEENEDVLTLWLYLLCCTEVAWASSIYSRLCVQWNLDSYCDELTGQEDEVL